MRIEIAEMDATPCRTDRSTPMPFCARNGRAPMRRTRWPVWESPGSAGSLWEPKRALERTNLMLRRSPAFAACNDGRQIASFGIVRSVAVSPSLAVFPLDRIGLRT
jgi:hypothetical protein